MIELNGIIPPVTTPFIGDEIALSKLADNIEILNKKNLTGYVVLGSNGESVFLTEAEKIKIISKVREHASSSKLVIAGTGTESIKNTISLSNEAAKIGADCALIITPHFFKSGMTHQAFINYYIRVADEIKIPLIIYNVTKFTGISIKSETIAKLAEHSNIIGIKNSTTNIEELKQTIDLVPENFAVLAGTGSVLLPALIAGACGGVLALANIAPAECIQIFEHYKVSKIKDAEHLQNILIPVNKAITATYGVAGLKAAMDMIGLYGGYPRLPLQPLNEKAKQEIKNILLEALLIKN